MGFGTFGRTGDEGVEAILLALATGYRHLDTAQSYGTEAACGLALRRSGLRREEVFVTTKVTGDNCRPGRLLASLETSRDTLGLDYIDLTLIHWPVGPAGRFDMAAYLPELAAAQERGITRLLGVSNFTIADLDEAERLLGPGRIATNQFERHPYLQNRKLVAECERRGIAVTCYLPLARGRCAGDPVLEPIARRHGATVHQIALAFSLCQGHIVIPTSGRHDRIRENYAAAGIRLTADEVRAIEGCDRGERQINPPWSPPWD
ncbi:MAG TPA: aldo/keto reductase [Alphaproteobacteria bacterium]|nr:aldo/keto reductase [Alphaproteobacteria bacterium]